MSEVTPTEPKDCKYCSECKSIRFKQSTRRCTRCHRSFCTDKRCAAEKLYYDANEDEDVWICTRCTRFKELFEPTNRQLLKALRRSSKISTRELTEAVADDVGCVDCTHCTSCGTACGKLTADRIAVNPIGEEIRAIESWCCTCNLEHDDIYANRNIFEAAVDHPENVTLRDELVDKCCETCKKACLNTIRLLDFMLQNVNNGRKRTRDEHDDDTNHSPKIQKTDD